MKRQTTGAGPLVGLALGCALAAALGAALLASGETGSPSERAYLVLPRASAAGPRAVPVVAATASAAPAAQRKGDAGVWSTPAQFAPPE